MERVGWDKTRHTVLVSEDLATGGIRSHLVLAKGNGDPWTAGKIKDDIEEFGFGGALVRIKSDQEPVIVDVQRSVIAKRGNAPTIPVNSPLEIRNPTDEWKTQSRRFDIWRKQSFQFWSQGGASE